MTTKSKQEYIKIWNDHIKDFDRLAFCENIDHHKRVKAIQDELQELVVEIANTKDLQ